MRPIKEVLNEVMQEMEKLSRYKSFRERFRIRPEDITRYVRKPVGRSASGEIEYHTVVYTRSEKVLLPVDIHHELGESGRRMR
jgi:hypothetical protein